MFDYNSATLYSQSRKEALLREIAVARLLVDQPRRSSGIAVRLSLRMGNLFIALGTRLKAPYESAREAISEQEANNYEALNYVTTAARR